MSKFVNNIISKYFSFIDNSIKRDDWVIEKLKSIKAGKSILDAGAGECRYKKYCNHLKYQSQDFCQYNVNDDHNIIKIRKWDVQVDIVSDISKIPLPNRSQDTILCTEVFEHIVNPNETVKEFSRLLVKGGNLILTLPFNSLVHMPPYYYYSGFSSYWLEKVLSESGFRILELTQSGTYYDYLLQELLRSVSLTTHNSKLFPLNILLAIILGSFLLIPMGILFLLSKTTKFGSNIGCFEYFVLAEKL
jgi:ubiquinone/menaquinone biosynthesis C-methylase UbiE